MKRVTFFYNRNIYFAALHAVVLLSFCRATYGQQHRRVFDSIFYDTAVNLASVDIDRAKEVADSLYLSSSLPIERVKALMLIVELEKNTGDMAGAIARALTAGEIAKAHNLYEWQARICGFLSTQYRSVGLKCQGKKNLLLGLELHRYITDEKVVLQLQGLAYQEMAYYHMEEKKHSHAIRSLEKANNCFGKLPQTPVVQCHIAASEEMMGRNFGFLKDPQHALAHYTNALEFLACATERETILKGFIYEGLARLYFEEENKEKALDYFNSALGIAVAADHLNLQVEVYRGLVNYYNRENDIKNYRHYNGLYQKALREFIKINKDSSDKIVNMMQQREDSLLFDHRLFVITIILCCFFLITYGILARRKTKRNYQRFKNIIHEIKKQPLGPALSHRPIRELMSQAKERDILERLESFEKGNGFLDKNISLSVLSGKLGVNSKYLSYVINKYKKQDFSTYVSQLRIHYIIKKVESQPMYLNYKISYMAEECGFSSHSKFATVFKNTTGMAPSAFLHYLRRSKKKGIAEVN